MTENLDYSEACDNIVGELSNRDDIPNYIKNYIKDLALDNVGTDGIGYDWDVNLQARELLRDRKVIVHVIWNNGEYDESDIEVSGLPFKFTPDDVNARLAQMFPNRIDIFADSVSIEFPSERISFYADLTTDCFDDQAWRENIAKTGAWPIELDDNGDATKVYVGNQHRVMTIDDNYSLV